MKTLNPRKVLLVHPLGYSKEAAARDVARMANIMPPLGLAGIAAYLEQRGFQVHIVDCFARPDSDGVIRDYLLTQKPLFLGMSCTTSNFLDAVRIAGLAKSVLPGVRTVMGGAHGSALKERALEPYPELDFICVGEGEETLTELLESDGKGIEEIRGIVFRHADGGASFTGYREKNLGLDTLPFPAYEKLDGYPSAYMLPLFNYPTTPNSSCIASRGCPYTCSYCDRSVFRRTHRANSAEYLYEHLRYLRERFGLRHVNFYDDQFTLNRKRVDRFTELMMERPLGMTYNCAVRAEHVDEELLVKMKASGCWMVSLGIETGDPELLARHRQNADLDMIAEKIRQMKRAGLRVKGLLMMGLPGESEESVRKSMRYVFSLPVDEFNLAKFTPYPGSPLYEHIHEMGVFEEDWELMDGLHFQFVPHGMSRELLQHLYAEFYRRHFMRPRVLWKYVAMLRHSPDSWLRLLRNFRSYSRFAVSNERLA
jgi:radical SAM superfamily enzyme YgiQ (UPF0313 family)